PRGTELSGCTRTLTCTLPASRPANVWITAAGPGEGCGCRSRAAVSRLRATYSIPATVLPGLMPHRFASALSKTLSCCSLIWLIRHVIGLPGSGRSAADGRDDVESVSSGPGNQRVRAGLVGGR